MVGHKLGHCRIVEKIGAGGMGEVYRAHDEHLDRDIAVKVLPPGTLADDAARQRFHREALVLGKLNHPNIQSVFDFDTQEGVDFLVTEYVPGVTLSDKLAAGPRPEEEEGRLRTQLARGAARPGGRPGGFGDGRRGCGGGWGKTARRGPGKPDPSGRGCGGPPGPGGARRGGREVFPAEPFLQLPPLWLPWRCWWACMWAR